MPVRGDVTTISLAIKIKDVLEATLRSKPGLMQGWTSWDDVIKHYIILLRESD